jgi:hypothetical protein
VTRPTNRASVRDRLAVALLIPAGTLAGHAAAYALVGPHAHGHADHGHGYLTGVAALAVPLAAAALLWHGCQGATRGRRPALGPLLVAQPLLFLVQELLEQLFAGHGMASVAQSPAVRVGVVAQVVAVGMTLLLVRAARATGRAVLATFLRLRPFRVQRPEMACPPFSAPFVSRSRRTLVSERGPPPLPALL